MGTQMETAVHSVWLTRPVHSECVADGMRLTHPATELFVKSV